MAGKLRLDPYPQQLDLNTNPQSTYDKAFPDIPQGYVNWNQYVKAVLAANAQGQLGPRPINSFGQDAAPEKEPLEWLKGTLGYARLAPILDQSDPDIQQFLDNTFYGGSSHDEFNFFGDQFGPALALLGLAGGGAAAFGAFGAPAAGVAGAAGAGEGALGSGELGLEALFGTGAVGGGGTVGVGGGLGTAAAGAGAAGAGAAGTLAAGAAGAGFGSIADWLRAALAAAGVGTAIYGGIEGAKARGEAQDAVDLQSQIAKQLFDEASPLRRTNLSELQQFLQSGRLPISLQAGLDPLVATGREGLEGQYNVARENILSRSPSRGGQLNKQLGDLELARAGSVGTLRSNILGQYELPIRQNLFQMAGNTALNQSTQGLAGLGTSANNFLSLAKDASAQEGASGATAGALLAMLLRQTMMQQNPVTGGPYSSGKTLPAEGFEYLF